jgi:hypothetical protein
MGSPRLAKVHVTTMVRIEAAGWKLAPGTVTTLSRVLDVLEELTPQEAIADAVARLEAGVPD